MYALIITLDIDAGHADQAISMVTEMVVPLATSLPGFTAGYWMRSVDNTKGFAVEVYESQASAEAALRDRPAPPPGLDLPWALAGAEVVEVVAST